MLRTESLSKRYGERWAVKGLDLTVNKGEVFGFLGPNGAGKTTTIRMMLGLIKPSSGRVYINGSDVEKDHLKALSSVGAIVETPAFYGYLSARANLEILGRISGGVGWERVDEVLELVGLLPRAGEKVKGYSQGMRQRLGIAQALLAKPEIVILDEPTNGLDPSGMIEMRKLIKRLAGSHGMTVFLSSHLLHEIEAVCTNVAVINNGILLVQGPVDELVKKENMCMDIKVSDRKKAVEELGRLPFISMIIDDNGSLEVHLPRDKASAVNRALVESGLEVSALIPREPSLEEYFLELTGGVSGDRSALKEAS